MNSNSPLGIISFYLLFVSIHTYIIISIALYFMFSSLSPPLDFELLKANNLVLSLY